MNVVYDYFIKDELKDLMIEVVIGMGKMIGYLLFLSYLVIFEKLVVISIVLFVL